MKVLQVVAELNGGGVESLLKNYLENMDLAWIDMDFITHGNKKGLLEDEFESRGCKIFHIAPASKNVKKHFQQINAIMKNGSYDLVQVHQGHLSWPILFLAWKNNIKVRIAHSHQAYRTKMNIKNRIFRQFTKIFATNLWACGHEAGVSMWGKSKFYIMNNAVNLDKFIYNKESRLKIRDELGIGSDTFVIGHIGRFTDQKNHEFIIEMASELKKRGFKFCLLLIGDGPKQEKIKNYAKELKCIDNLFFLGLRNDVERCLSAMDLMILPSNFEGLPVVMVEAEANGVPILASDTITKEVKILENVTYLSISKVDTWVSSIIGENVDVNMKRLASSYAIKKLGEAGYDIKLQAIKLQEIYRKLIDLEEK